MDKDQKESIPPFIFHSEKFYTLGLMTNKIAHEINNSIQGMILLLNFMEMDFPSNRNIALLSQEIHKIKDLVQSVSTYARANDHVFKPIDLATVINETVDLLKNLTGDQALTEINFLPGQRRMIRGNFFYLQLAFLNLLFYCSQSLRRSSKSHSRIEIETLTDSQMHTVHIRWQPVLDENTTAKAGEIKFDLIKNILNLHQGKLQFIDESESSFVVTLPKSGLAFDPPLV